MKNSPSWYILFLFLPLLLTSLAFLSTHAPLRDWLYYQTLYGEILSGKIPYRDFFFEYPLGFSFLLLYPAKFLKVGAEAFLLYYLSLTTLATFLSFFFLRRITQEKASSFSRQAFLTVFLSTPFFFFYYDIFPILFVILSLFFLLKGRYNLSFSLLGVGGLLKYFPAILAISFSLFLLGKGVGAKRVFGALSSFFLALLFLSAVGIIFLGWESLSVPLLSFAQRGLHVETILGGILALFPNYPIFLTNAFEISVPSWALALYKFALPAGLGLYLFGSFRKLKSKPTPPNLAKVCLLGISTLLLTSKIFSPQFLLWIFPFVFLLYGYTKDSKVFWGYLLVLALTILYLLNPLYLSLLTLSHLPAAVLINIRNLVLLGYVIYIWRLKLKRSM